MLLPLQNWIQHLALPDILVIGLMILLAFYAGKSVRPLRLPTIIGFMLVGVLLGPSLLNFVSKDLQAQLEFVTQLALGAVALSIGLELDLKAIYHKGKGVLIQTVIQLTMTFFLVGSALYLLTGNLALALPMAAIATTTGPAGTMGVIHETRARGPLSKNLYTILGFDNAMAIVLFGFALATARNILALQAGVGVANPLATALIRPLTETVLSLALGAGIGMLFCLLLRMQNDKKSHSIQTFAMILVTIGICSIFHLSFIFSLLVTGALVANTQPDGLLERLRNALTDFMPLLYVLFFALAGAKLEIRFLQDIWLLGLTYVIFRCAGKIGGAYVGALRGGLEEKLRRFTGMALLSQAGVAIGLALIVNSELGSYGPVGAHIGNTVLTAVTGACIVFELIGPLMTEKALEQAGEIPSSHRG